MKIYTIFSRIGLLFCIFTLLALLSGCNKCDENEAKIIRDFAGVGDLGFKELSDELYVINSMEEFEQIAKDIHPRTASSIRGIAVNNQNFDAYTLLLVKTYSSYVLSLTYYGDESISYDKFEIPICRSNLIKKSNNKYTLEISFWGDGPFSTDMTAAGYYLPILCNKIPNKSVDLTLIKDPYVVFTKK